MDETAASCRSLCCSLKVKRKCDIWAIRAGECIAMAPAMAAGPWSATVGAPWDPTTGDTACGRIMEAPGECWEAMAAAAAAEGKRRAGVGWPLGRGSGH